MARMGKNTRRKRESTPTFYVIPRKEKAFATGISPGPHPKPVSYDPVTLLRDVLKLVYNRREALRVIRDGKLIVDGKVRRDHRFPIGLMDVVELLGTGLVYRMLPYKGKLIYPVEIPSKEKNVKLCAIKTKRTLKGEKIQLGTHDGRSFLVMNGSKYNIGDSLLIETSSQRILEVIKLAPNSLVLVIKGARTGSLGEIIEVKKGSIMVKPSVKISFKGEEVVLPKETVMPVGTKAPVITLPIEG